MDKNKKGNGKRNFFYIIAIALMIIVLVLVMCLRGCTTNKRLNAVSGSNNTETSGVMEGDLPSMSREEIQQQLQAKTDKSMFTVQASSMGEVMEGSKTLNLTVANPGNNNKNCRFDVIMGNDTLYQSPVLQPKSYMRTEEMVKTIPSGNHDAVVRYHIFNDNCQVTGVADVEVMIQCK